MGLPDDFVAISRLQQIADTGCIHAGSREPVNHAFPMGFQVGRLHNATTIEFFCIPKTVTTELDEVGAYHKIPRGGIFPQIFRSSTGFTPARHARPRLKERGGDVGGLRG